MEDWISAVLLGGVLLAAAVLLLGLVRLILSPSPLDTPITIAGILEAESHATSLAAIIDGVAAGRPTSLIRLGILILIMTPLARVAMTFALFLVRQEWDFVLMTGMVLVILLLGLAGAGT